MRSFHTQLILKSVIPGIMILFFAHSVFAEDIEIDLGSGGASSSKGKATGPSTQPAPTKVQELKEQVSEKVSDIKETSRKSQTQNPVINQITSAGGGEGSRVSIIGSNLSEPKVSKISSKKMLIKFSNTKLNIPKQIKGEGGIVKSIRSDVHSGNSAWIVLDVISLKNWELSKSDEGFTVSLNQKNGEETPDVPNAKSTQVPEKNGDSEKKLYSRLTDISVKTSENGLKMVFTADGTAKYNVRKLTQPEKLIIHFNNTKLEVTDKNKKILNLDQSLRKAGLASLELRQIGPQFSPTSEAILTLTPGTTYQIDRDLNQVIISTYVISAQEKPLGKKGNLNQLVSMDVEGADLNAVVKTLASETGFEVDFVSGPLSGIVNEKFKDIPMKTALATLLGTGSYDFELQGNTLRIGPQQALKASKSIMPHITEILTPSGGMNPSQLDSLVRNFISPSNGVLAVPDPIRNVLILNGTPSDVENYKRAIKDLKLDEGRNSDRITRIVKLNYADANNINGLLSAYLTPIGRVQVLQQKLIIWETASNMGVLLELIKELDRKPAQVLIESSIIEIDDEKDLAAGINWSASRSVGDPTVNANFNNLPSAGGGLFPGNFTFGTIKNGLNINATLSALESHKKGKIISRPRIATASGVQAEIQTVENVVISTTTNTILPGGNVQQVISSSLLALPIDLRVTPRITDDGRITTIVNAQITSQSGPAPAGGGGLPPTSVQTATTTITTKNGETIVIGGLVREVLQDSVNGIPLLSSLPIIGTLFQEHDRTNRKVELIIFITPTILED